VALRSVEMRDLQSISLPPLPGTAAEAAALAKRFGNSAKVFLGPNATKAKLRQVNSPHILHLATHGFFLPEIELGKPNTVPGREEEIPKGKLVNPMHSSGLALAGAQTTLEAWSRGETPPIENNGIVTAEEVGGLKLDGTWLVVLSACETGSGEAKAGEGVMGLRRGFVQAGAQNLLMTLWPISDETTVQIMLGFYDMAEKTKNAPQALAEVQRDWLVKLRKEHGFLDAVRLAGPSSCHPKESNGDLNRSLGVQREACAHFTCRPGRACGRYRHPAFAALAIVTARSNRASVPHRGVMPSARST
jgi:CHAT domain-containing protein